MSSLRSLTRNNLRVRDLALLAIPLTGPSVPARVEYERQVGDETWHRFRVTNRNVEGTLTRDVYLYARNAEHARAQVFSELGEDFWTLHAERVYPPRESQR